jgi:hypothetical protein
MIVDSKPGFYVGNHYSFDFLPSASQNEMQNHLFHSNLIINDLRIKRPLVDG